MVLAVSRICFTTNWQLSSGNGVHNNTSYACHHVGLVLTLDALAWKKYVLTLDKSVGSSRLGWYGMRAKGMLAFDDLVKNTQLSLGGASTPTVSLSLRSWRYKMLELGLSSCHSSKTRTIPISVKRHRQTSTLQTRIPGKIRGKILSQENQCRRRDTSVPKNKILMRRIFLRMRTRPNWMTYIASKVDRKYVQPCFRNKSILFNNLPDWTSPGQRSCPDSYHFTREHRITYWQSNDVESIDIWCANSNHWECRGWGSCGAWSYWSYTMPLLHLHTQYN